MSHTQSPSEPRPRQPRITPSAMLSIRCLGFTSFTRTLRSSATFCTRVGGLRGAGAAHAAGDGGGTRTGLVVAASFYRGSAGAARYCAPQYLLQTGQWFLRHAGLLPFRQPANATGICDYIYESIFAGGTGGLSRNNQSLSHKSRILRKTRRASLSPPPAQSCTTSS